MRYNLIFVILSAAILHSCGDSDTSMIGQVPARPMVNPNVGVLLGEGEFSATLTDKQTILGVGNGRIFETKDQFNSFQFSNSYMGLRSTTVYQKDDAVITFDLPDYNQFNNPITLYRSTNKGATVEKAVIEGIDDSFSLYEIVKAQFMNKNEGFLVVYNWYYYVPKRALVYKLNFDKSEAVLIGQVQDDFKPVEVKFVDENNGFILLISLALDNDGMNTYISRTTDGGKTWSTPSPIDLNRRVFNIATIDANRLIVFHGEVAYYSANGGIDWQRITLPPYHNYVITFVNNTGYALGSPGVISKSVDGGLTWNSAGTFDLRNSFPSDMSLYFYDESVGIAYGKDRLYLTEDGAQSWKMLIYPFSYVKK